MAYAHARGVHVEAELGTLGGIEDLGEQAVRSMLTDPDQAVRFATETEVDALAVAIGTSHGAYKFTGEPHLDLDRLREIASRVSQRSCSTVPVVAGGGRRAGDALRREAPHARGIGGAHPAKAVKLGIAKVNTDSDRASPRSDACARCSWSARTSSTSTS